MIPFFGASVYDDPVVYEKSSPIRFIKNVKTPTLVIVGEHDAECPAAILRILACPESTAVLYDAIGHSSGRRPLL